ncbi:hypothetical protein Pth03_32870 [Planotetraspora thailandica]|uniref:Uncharacterized protein n=1 Tax=Planotetraspora thailandica TaxID=487172 RepID=A0A8J3UZV4_9ACTN|nr:hypothetical protein [Planotetraspora thailandica]GII54898.1 hypothetical protein Pth03_32870 [Planotetraspora thailandica]
MPCYRCGARQVDPVRGASPWKRGVRGETQVLICPDCQRARDLDLDACLACGSTALVRRLGEVECRACHSVRPARSADAQTSTRGGSGGQDDGALSAEVEAALGRVLGRS